MPENDLFAAYKEANKTIQAVNTLQNELRFQQLCSTKALRNYNLADYSYEVIIERIKEFEDALDNDHEVALQLASFGQSITLSVVDIGYSNPSTLVFHGYVGDQPATLIQHMSQLNFLLLAVKKADPEKPPRRIGFESPSED